MDINGPRRVDSSRTTRSTRAAAASGTKNFSAEPASEAQTAAALTGTGPIAAVDSILALQGIDEPTDQRRQAVDRGEQLLRLLDQIRDGLLAGGIPVSTLNRLALAVSKRRDLFADAKLQTILDEIEVRARVELAKLEQAGQTVARTV